MTEHEVLVAARNILDQRGYDWWQYEDRHGCSLCPEGVIDAVPHSQPRGLHEMNGAKRAVLDQLPPSPREVQGLCSDRLSDRFALVRNLVRDGREFTKDEVLALFDKAIAATAPAPDTSFLTESREEVVA